MANVAQFIAGKIAAIRNCEKSGNVEWIHKHEEQMIEAIRDCLPNGSGFNAGVQIDSDSQPNRITFETSFHHMNDAGYYDGWTNHKIIVTPCLVHGFSLRVTGKNRNGIKDYIGEVFSYCLAQSYFKGE